MINYITGSSGFIGRHLLSKLQGETVRIEYQFIFDHQYEDCQNFFYLASYGNMADHTDVSEILRANVGMVGRVVGGILEGEFKCDHFIYVSSSSVLLPVQTPYSRAKRAAEDMILASGISATIVRPFSVTGVGEQPQHLIPTLIRSCMEEEVMPFVAWPVHDFVDVSDVVDGLLLAAERKETCIVELGSGDCFTNACIKEFVQEACGKPAKLDYAFFERPYDGTNWKCTNPMPGWGAQKWIMQSIQEMVEAYKNAH